jgi:hypothetical protein
MRKRPLAQKRPKNEKKKGLSRKFCLLFFCFVSLQLPVCSADPFASPALNLVVPERADLMAKYLYAKHREWGVSDIFAVHLYYEHLRVWNGFWERNPPKRTFEDFLHGFDCLLDSVKEEAFVPSRSLVLLDREGRIRDGAHRVAACLLYDRPVFLENTSYLCPDWGFSFFEEKGLSEKYLDAMAIQYCELKPNTYLMVIFPSAVGHQEEVDNILMRFADVVYKKQVFLTANGGWNLIQHVYDGEPFIYDEDKARYKSQQCFPLGLISTNPVRVYLLESNYPHHIKACKAAIRAVFKIGNHSVHVTDTHEQAIVMSKALFNKNSLHCLNFRKPVEFDHAEHYLNQYKQWIRSTHQNEDWLCVDSGAVLAIYGLRDCNDWDYLHFDRASFHSGIPGITGHNDTLCYHRWEKERILFDPDYHFFYKGVKFCSLPVVKAMKENRGEPKDLHDLALIKGI